MKLKSLLALFLTVMTVLPLIASCTGEPEQTTGEISENTETSDTLTEADTTVKAGEIKGAFINHGLCHQPGNVGDCRGHDDR